MYDQVIDVEIWQDLHGDWVTAADERKADGRVKKVLHKWGPAFPTIARLAGRYRAYVRLCDTDGTTYDVRRKGGCAG